MTVVSWISICWHGWQLFSNQPSWDLQQRSNETLPVRAILRQIQLNGHSSDRQHKSAPKLLIDSISRCIWPHCHRYKQRPASNVGLAHCWCRELSAMVLLEIIQPCQLSIGSSNRHLVRRIPILVNFTYVRQSNEVNVRLYRLLWSHKYFIR